MKISEYEKTNRYRTQKRFQIFRLPQFKQFGVIGLDDRLFKFTRYFKKESEAVEYCKKMIEETKGFHLTHVRMESWWK